MLVKKVNRMFRVHRPMRYTASTLRDRRVMSKDEVRFGATGADARPRGVKIESAESRENVRAHAQSTKGRETIIETLSAR